jgi:hypothetical protein
MSTLFGIFAGSELGLLPSSQNNNNGTVVDLSNYVTLNTTQNITGQKTFTNVDNTYYGTFIGELDGFVASSTITGSLTVVPESGGAAGYITAAGDIISATQLSAPQLLITEDAQIDGELTVTDITADTGIINDLSCDNLSVSNRISVNQPSPSEAIDINGNIKLSSAGNGIIFSDGSKITSAAYAPGSGLNGTALLLTNTTSDATLSWAETVSASYPTHPAIVIRRDLSSTGYLNAFILDYEPYPNVGTTNTNRLTFQDSLQTKAPQNVVYDRTTTYDVRYPWGDPNLLASWSFMAIPYTSPAYPEPDGIFHFRPYDENDRTILADWDCYVEYYNYYASGGSTYVICKLNKPMRKTSWNYFTSPGVAKAIRCTQCKSKTVVNAGNSLPSGNYNIVDLSNVEVSANTNLLTDFSSSNVTDNIASLVINPIGNRVEINNTPGQDLNLNGLKLNVPFFGRTNFDVSEYRGRPANSVGYTQHNVGYTIEWSGLFQVSGTDNINGTNTYTQGATETIKLWGKNVFTEIQMVDNNSYYQVPNEVQFAQNTEFTKMTPGLWKLHGYIQCPVPEFVGLSVSTLSWLDPVGGELLEKETTKEGVETYVTYPSTHTMYGNANTGYSGANVYMRPRTPFPDAHMIVYPSSTSTQIQPRIGFQRDNDNLCWIFVKIMATKLM